MHTSCTGLCSVHRAGCTGCDCIKSVGFAKTQKKGRGRRKNVESLSFNPPSNVWLSYRAITKDQCVFINWTLKLGFKCLWKEEKPNTCATSQALCVLVGTGISSFPICSLRGFSAVPGTEELSFPRALPTTTTACTENGISGGHSMKFWKDFRDVRHPVGLGLPKTQLKP